MPKKRDISSELLYGRLFESANEGILILDAVTGMVVDANPFLIRLLGFTHEEFLGKKIWEPGFIKELAAGETGLKELQMQTADGRLIDMELVSSVYQVNRRRVIQCNIRDITDRRRASEIRRVSEERYRSMYAESRDAIMLTTPDDGFIAGNQAAIEIFACRDEKDFIGRSPKSMSPEFQPDGAISSEKAQEMMQLALENGSHYFEWMHRRADGTDFPATVLLSRIGTGGSRLIQAAVRDISEQKKAQEELRLYQMHLEEIVKERTAGLEKEKKYHFVLGQASIAFAEATSEHELIKSVADWQMRLTGGFINIVAKYLPLSKDLVVAHISMDADRKKELELLIGKSMSKLRFKVDSARKQAMLQTVVNRPGSMTDLTWGLVTHEASESIRQILGF
ncbi:MAG: PAS domain S-box protein, partial [Syntrophales bacterium]